MLDIYSFVKDMINCENTLRKIEVFQKWKLSDCKVYLFDENISNFKGEGFKESNYGKFYLIGLGDYEKTWVIDKNTVKNKSIEIKANKVVNYDLNIFTYIHT